MTSNADVHGKVVAITGGARGIGLATAAALTGLGARVAIGDIDQVALTESATRLNLSTYCRLDVTDVESFAAFLDHVEEQLGPIDVLINNAGIMPAGRLVDESDNVTKRIIDINVLGVINGAKLAAQRMVPRGSGHVINVASLAGEIYTPGLATYCASKYAVVGFTDAARVEHRGSGVDFSLMMPSFVNTELTAGTHGVRGVRNAEPHDIAAAIVGLIRKPRARVRVTKFAGALAAAQKFMPRTVAEGLTRALGGENVFLDGIDADERKGYEDRARHS
ncbi:SDR family oxidoreductase [Mycobacterium sp. CPCC 205372]|uniref:SDR family oxidoreductase n=1 Tax=Mycobacterium hippophais TaxID=3016340 RepID=A0ABT4PXI6_9MYCO|nr:SDR family oxidoreductase [Mycobacterium hippophais]MCZ8381284.1 SDR family oxidoreductase [Mycobacterium hippophais]